jgi:uncharacterized protein YbgA (DUF1722 family)/uncharacterized protein YbbK (DUF523 family)
MAEKIRIGISSCLLGEQVRYDGGHRHDRYVTGTLGEYFEWVSVCPEVECGLPVPREAMRLVGRPEAPRLKTLRTGVDHTERMLAWAGKRLARKDLKSVCGFIFKARSPSSGIGGGKVYTEKGMPSYRGAGIFGGEFVKTYPLVPVIDDGRLHDPRLRENFIERAFIFRRWQDFLKKGGRRGGLVDFHTDHKLLLLSHSPKHYSLLGRLVADAKKHEREKVHAQYISVLMEGLSLMATVKKNTNVLHHIMGYFKKDLSRDEKQELLDVIEQYHRGLVPLIVPVTMLKHYVRRLDVEYLKRQHYLSPHPMELMLRNHV